VEQINEKCDRIDEKAFFVFVSTYIVFTVVFWSVCMKKYVGNDDHHK
jgi:hypothetical protein